jgi:hypothetical protein
MRDTRIEEGGELNVEETWEGEGKRNASMNVKAGEKR